MLLFTRVFLFIALISCFYSCAHRPQALYQVTQREPFDRQFAHAVNLVSAPEALPAEPVPADESLTTSTATEPNRYTGQVSEIKKSIIVDRQKTAHAATEPTKIKQKKSRLLKLLAKYHPKEDAPQTSGLAIASLVSGILAFFVLGIVFGPLAVIFGGIALSKIRQNPEVKGRGMAVAGLVLGIVATVLVLVILIAR